MNLSVTSHDKQTFSTTVVAPEDNLQKGAHEIRKRVVFWSFQHSIKNDLKKGNMKKLKKEKSCKPQAPSLTMDLGDARMKSELV